MSQQADKLWGISSFKWTSWPDSRQRHHRRRTRHIVHSDLVAVGGRTGDKNADIRHARRTVCQHVTCQMNIATTSSAVVLSIAFAATVLLLMTVSTAAAGDDFATAANACVRCPSQCLCYPDQSSEKFCIVQCAEVGLNRFQQLDQLPDADTVSTL
jgi:hypothetical protein